MPTYQYLSETVPIYWTKRFVRYRKCGLRRMFRRARKTNRVHRRQPLWMQREYNKPMYKREAPFKPKRQNFNNFYQPIQLRTPRK